MSNATGDFFSDIKSYIRHPLTATLQEARRISYSDAFTHGIRAIVAKQPGVKLEPPFFSKRWCLGLF